MASPAGAPERPRAAVFVPVFGTPSEVWAVRQCLGFRQIRPVVICWQRHPDAPANDHGLSVIELDAPWRSRRSLTRRIASRLGRAWAELPDAAERREIAEVLRETRADLALCHFAWTGLRVGAAVGREIPAVWHVHGRDLSMSLRSAAYRAAMRKVLPTAAELVAVGSFQLDTLHRLGLPAERGELIPCGAPLEQFVGRPIPERSGGAIRYIAVGRLSPEKGVLESVEAFARVQREHPNSEFVVVGAGELGEPAAALARRCGVAGRVRFAGQLAPQAVAEELASAHVFVQHSRPHRGAIEGFGVTLTEAGASGLPLVVSRIGGIIDQVEDGQNGILFEPCAIDAQARAMLRLAADEPLRRRMGARAREMSKRFDSARQIQRLEELLLDTAQNSMRKQR